MFIADDGRKKTHSKINVTFSLTLPGSLSFFSTSYPSTTLPPCHGQAPRLGSFFLLYTNAAFPGKTHTETLFFPYNQATLTLLRTVYSSIFAQKRFCMDHNGEIPL